MDTGIIFAGHVLGAALGAIAGAAVAWFFITVNELSDALDQVQNHKGD